MLGLGINDSIVIHTFSNPSLSEVPKYTANFSLRERPVCVFVAWHKKELPCEVCYWKIIFGIIFLITGLSLGILPLSVQSSAI